ncbi:unnamed protein product [Rhizophagus irregularis]|nr:unnamed protein product [Rhizophagus irregularis]
MILSQIYPRFSIIFQRYSKYLYWNFFFAGMIDHIFKYGGRKLNIVLCTLNETFSTIIKISPSRYVCVDISIFQSSKESAGKLLQFNINTSRFI